MMAVMLRLTLISLIVGNSFKFTTLVQISTDAIWMVYKMCPCADILSGDPPDAIRMASGEHWNIVISNDRKGFYPAFIVRFP
jgi:hypothetical protein